MESESDQLSFAAEFWSAIAPERSAVAPKRSAISRHTETVDRYPNRTSDTPFSIKVFRICYLNISIAD